MAGRYVITGAQIGIIRGALESNDRKLIDNMINEVYKNQFISDSDKFVNLDIQRYKDSHLREES